MSKAIEEVVGEFMRCFMPRVEEFRDEVFAENSIRHLLAPLSAALAEAEEVAELIARLREVQIITPTHKRTVRVVTRSRPFYGPTLLVTLRAADAAMQAAEGGTP